MARHPKLSALLIFLFFAFIACGAYLVFRDTTGPEISFSHTAGNVSPALPLTITVSDRDSGIKRLSIAARYKENIIPLATKEFTEKRRSQSITFTLEKSGLKNNETFELEILATDDSFGGFGFGNKSREIYPLRLDGTPPRMTVKSPVPYVRKGGSSCVVYSIAKEVQQTGIKVGDLFFPSFRQENGDFLCFFAFPYFMEMKDFSPQLVALDQAGNLEVAPLPVTPVDRRFKSDTIGIGQGFLDAKDAEFARMVPGNMTQIERFLKVNGDVRRENALALMEIGKNTTPQMLWKGAFLRLPRAASRAGFADHRSYMWEGQKVDEQTHLGFDLASVRQAPVPASNSGRVIFTGYLGIYGNLVVIDHGLGLQSLYSHLSSISVDQGQTIERGHIIGNTGATGMAGGDHLHFGILISGLEVTPLEWLDDHWIKDNIVDRIKAAGGTAPEFEVSPPKPPAAGRQGNTRRR